MSDVNDEAGTSPDSELIGWFLDPTEVRAETRRPGIVTGLSVLVPSPDSATLPLVADLAGQLGQMFRLEAVVAADDAVTLWRDSMGEGLAAASVGFRVATPAVPHRSAALDAVSGLASGEFVLLARGALPDLDLLVPGLLRVWIDGADALVMPSVPVAMDPDEEPTAIVSGHVADLAGLTGAPLGGVLVLRRWLARYLFNELDRTIDPASEVRQRLRSVGARLVELSSPPA